MKFSFAGMGSEKPRCCTWIGAIPGINAGWGVEQTERSPTEDLEDADGWKAGHEPSTCLCSPDVSLAASMEVWPGGWGRVLCPSSLLCWHPTWNIAPSWGSSAQEKHGSVRESPEEGHKKIIRVIEHFSYECKLWEMGWFCLEKDLRTTYWGLSILKEQARNMGEDFSQGTVMIWLRVRALNYKTRQVRIDIQDRGRYFLQGMWRKTATGLQRGGRYPI